MTLEQESMMRARREEVKMEGRREKRVVREDMVGKDGGSNCGGGGAIWFVVEE